MPTTLVQTTCPMDCPDTCALEVEVADGTIRGIGEARDYPLTDGFICDKVSRFDQRVYHEERLLFPMRRSGPKGDGAFVRLSWDEALAEITCRFQDIIQQWGGEAEIPQVMLMDHSWPYYPQRR